MPTSPRKTTASRAEPATFAGSASIGAPIDQVAPAVLALPADGVPRTKGVIIQVLAGRHGAEAVALALIRLSVTSEVKQGGSEYTLGDGGPPDARASAGAPGRRRAQRAPRAWRRAGARPGGSRGPAGTA